MDEYPNIEFLIATWIFHPAGSEKLRVSIYLNNFESLRLKWKETMHPSLSCFYPFDPFLSFFQSTITPILLNPYISIHIYPPLILVYSFLSSTYLNLSFSIVHLYTSILFYLPPISVNSFLSLLQSLITPIFFNPVSLSNSSPRLSMSILFNPLSIQNSAYLFEFLSSYPYESISILFQYESPLSF